MAWGISALAIKDRFNSYTQEQTAEYPSEDENDGSGEPGESNSMDWEQEKLAVIGRMRYIFYIVIPIVAKQLGIFVIQRGKYGLHVSMSICLFIHNGIALKRSFGQVVFCW
jgi:hypothetical protein